MPDSEPKQQKLFCVKRLSRELSPESKVNVGRGRKSITVSKKRLTITKEELVKRGGTEIAAAIEKETESLLKQERLEK